MLLKDKVGTYLNSLDILYDKKRIIIKYKDAYIYKKELKEIISIQCNVSKIRNVPFRNISFKNIGTVAFNKDLDKEDNTS
tara:strand:+ start:287 stop:526 length:240 start_codon:yes stop_codon:yes gene_type:complete